jgi:transcriptional regulator with XRE-family HTH domain
MKPLRRYVDEQIKKNPDFAKELEEAEADVRLAIELARVREQRGLTQRQLAARAGMKQPQVARLEQGGALPNMSTLLRVLKVLGARLEIDPDGSCRVRMLKEFSLSKRKILSHA